MDIAQYPLAHLRRYTEKYPKFWRVLEDFRAHRGKPGYPDWPDWCYCPAMATWDIIKESTIEAFSDASVLSLIGAWRVTKGVYKFDDTLAAELLSTPIIGNIPSELLQRLPAWCVYVSAPGLPLNARGFFGSVEYDPHDSRNELRLILDLEEGLLAAGLYVDEGCSIASGVEQMWRTIDSVQKRLIKDPFTDIASPMLQRRHNAAYAKQQASIIEPCLSLLLYLCSDEPDCVPPLSPRPTLQKSYAAHEPKAWDVGFKLGGALRIARQNYATALANRGTSTAPRPHIRSAHWHTYWIGPKRSTPKLKWLAPIKVGKGDTIPTVYSE